jgi:signal peptidase II
VLFADQLAKRCAEQSIGEGRIIRLKHGVELRCCKNRGFALNKLDDHPGLIKGASAAAAALSAAAFCAGLSKDEPALEKAGMALVLGGGLSNTMDRLLKHEVTDYISFSGRRNGRPGDGEKMTVVYNLADFAVFAGAALTVLSSSFKGLKKEQQEIGTGL